MDWVCADLKAAPPPRHGHGAAVIVSDAGEEKQRLLVAGGDTGDQFLSDIWELDLEEFVWKELREAYSRTSPLPRGFFAQCAGTASLPGLLLCGGAEELEAEQLHLVMDLWSLDACNGSARWTKLDALAGAKAAPSPRLYHAMVAVESLVLVHGGTGEDGQQLDDLWVFDAGARDESRAGWVQVRTTEPRPCKRDKHSLIYCEAHGVVLMFGGEFRDDGEEGGEEEGESESYFLNDLWLLKPIPGQPEEWKWEPLHLEGSGPSPRSRVSWTVSGQVVFLFGGRGLAELPTSNEDADEGEVQVAYLDDLWALDLTNKAWYNEEDMGYEGESPVEGRAGHCLVASSGQLILYGGFVGDGFDDKFYICSSDLGGPPADDGEADGDGDDAMATT
jgi:hypothetical protein